jgi:hypothetical protein
MGRSLSGGSGMQSRNGDLIIADLVGSTRHASHLGLQHEMRDLGGGWGDNFEKHTILDRVKVKHSELKKKTTYMNDRPTQATTFK